MYENRRRKISYITVDNDIMRARITRTSKYTNLVRRLASRSIPSLAVWAAYL